MQILPIMIFLAVFGVGTVNSLSYEERQQRQEVSELRGGR